MPDDSNGQAGAVTLEMVEAGSEASLPYLSLICAGDMSKLAPMLRAIYAAMYVKAPRASSSW